MRRRTFLQAASLLLVPRLSGATTVDMTPVLGPNRAHPLAKKLQAWWLVLPHLSGGTQLRDLMGQNHGTLIGMAGSPTITSGRSRVTTRQGGFGEIRCDGTNDYVTNTTAVWPVGGPVTVAFWLKTPGTTSGSGAFGVSGGENPNRFGGHVPADDANIYWDYGNFSTTGRLSTSFAAYTNQWTHVTLVSAGTGGTWKAIYLQGVLVASDSVSDGPSVTLTGMDMGRWNLTGLVPELLIFDDFRVYTRTLSSPQVLALYVNSRQGYPGLLQRMAPATKAASAAARRHRATTY